jgi:hypothetical protein
MWDLFQLSDDEGMTMLHDITFREGISGHGGVRATSSSIVSAAVPATSWNPKAQVASSERVVGSPSDGYSSAPSTRSRKERRSAQGSSHQSSQSHKHKRRSAQGSSHQSSQSHKHNPSAEVHTRHGAVAEHIARGRVTNVLNPDAHGIKDGVKLHKALATPANVSSGLDGHSEPRAGLELQQHSDGSRAMGPQGAAQAVDTHTAVVGDQKAIASAIAPPLPNLARLATTRDPKPASGIRDVAFSTQALALPLMTRQAPVPAFNSKPLPQHDSPPSPRMDERSTVGRASRPGSLLGPSNMAATMADFGASAYGGGRASVEVAAKAKARGNGSLLAQRLQQAASAGGDSHEAGRRAWRAKTDLAQKV